nr:ATP-binding protein [Vicinamibacterales bacterium]
RLARAVSAEAERLTELTNEYLTFARLPRPASTPQSLAPLLEEVACFSRSEAERAGVVLRLDVDEAAAAVVDAKLVRQVLLNLVRNAVDAMPDGGCLTLRSSREGDRVALDVIDTGPGVPAGLQERIFEPFFSTKTHGTGLGLAVARRVAREHGGDLRLLPAPRGASFRLDFPAAIRPAVASQAGAPELAAAGGRA